MNWGGSVVAEIRIYMEGGGDAKDSKGQLRQGLHKLLLPLIQKACDQKVRFRIVACGSRNDAFKAFKTA